MYHRIQDFKRSKKVIGFKIMYVFLRKHFLGPYTYFKSFMSEVTLFMDWNLYTIFFRDIVSEYLSTF